MLGRLDRYVAGTVIGAWVAGLVFLVLLSALFDVLLNLFSYLDNAQQAGIGTLEFVVELGSYYAINVPFLFVTIGPFVTVIAGMFAVARLLGANEIVPMLFTGRGIVRVLTPLFAVGVLSAAGMVLCWQYVIPALSGTHDALRCTLEGRAATVDDLVVRLREDGQRVLFCDEYDHGRRRMSGVSVVDEGSSAQDAVVVHARHADWNPETGAWDLVDGERRTVRDVRNQAQLALPGLTPELLWRTSKEDKELAALSFAELADLRELRPARVDFQLAMQTHLTLPLANLILLVLALPFSISFERGRKLERVLFAVVVCGLYFVVDITCHNLARSAYLHPVFAAWLPPIFFGALGIVFFGSIRT